MKSTRDPRRVIVLSTQRHPNSDEKVSPIIHNLFIDKIPLLIIDVNFGGDKGKQRIILYDED
jgi:hypothetical protein